MSTSYLQNVSDRPLSLDKDKDFESQVKDINTSFSTSWQKQAEIRLEVAKLKDKIESLTSARNDMEGTIAASTYAGVPPIYVSGAGNVSLGYNTANLTLTGGGLLDTIQPINAGSTPTFAGLTLTGFAGAVYAAGGVLAAGTLAVGYGGTGAVTLTNHSLLVGSGVGAIIAIGAATNGQLPIGSTGADPVLATLTGTANQVNVTNGAGTITFSIPQDIHTGASPQFVGETLTGNLTMFTGQWIGLGAGTLRLQWDGPGLAIDCFGELDMNSNDISSGGNIHSTAGAFYLDADSRYYYAGFSMDSYWGFNGADTIHEFDALNAGTTDWRLQQNGADRLVVLTGNYAGVGIDTPVSHWEVYDATSSITTLTTAHATNDVEIRYRTDAAPTVKWVHGVYGTNDNYVFGPYTTIAAAVADLYANAWTMDVSTGNFCVGATPGTNSKIKSYYSATNGPTPNGILGLNFTVDQNTTANGSHPAYGLLGYARARVDAGKTNSGSIYGGIFYSFKMNNYTGNLSGSCIGIAAQYGKYQASSGNITGTASGLLLMPMYGTLGNTTQLQGIAINAPFGTGTATVEFAINSLWDAPSKFAGHVRIDADSRYYYCGASQDMGMWYDGTYGNIATDLVAASDLRIDCGANKTLELQTVVWEDINAGAYTFSLPAANTPDIDEFVDSTGTDTGIETYAVAIGEHLAGSFEFQHWYKEGSDFYFHIHWQGITAPGGGTDNVNWKLTYTITRNGVALQPPTTITKEQAIDTQYEFIRHNFDVIDGSTAGSGGGNVQIGDQFLFDIERIAASADDYAGDCLLATIGIHAEKNTMGSRQVLTK